MPIRTSVARSSARLAALSLVALAAPRATLHAQAPVAASAVAVPPVIAVLATGEAQVTPDRARLTLGVQTQAPTAAEASARNARLQRAVLDTLRAIGIPAEQITTSGYNVFPEQEFNPQTRRSRITGYNVQNMVTVELHRVEQAGPALDAVLAKGANNAGGLQFYSSQAEAVRRRALAQAVERARADAEALASAAGGRLGELVELSSAGFEGPRPAVMDMATRSAASSAPPTPINEGTLTMSATVSARWRFVSGR